MAKLVRRTISRRTVETLPVGEREIVYWDSELPGFGVRVYPTGSKTYLAQTRTNGKSRRFGLGRHGIVSVDQARREAARIIAGVKSGGEPRAKSNGASRKNAGPTVREAAKRYLREHAEVRCKPTTVHQLRGVIDRYLVPALGDQCLGEIGHDEVASLHYRLRDKPSAANSAVRVLSRLYRMAGLWGLELENGDPCRFVHKFQEHPRERFLTEGEFQLLGRVLEEFEKEGGIHLSSVAAFRLLMLTGYRCSEVLTLRWGMWTWQSGRFIFGMQKPVPGLWRYRHRRVKC